MSAAAALKRTPLHAVHEAAGARLVDFAGWEMPLQYSSPRAEHDAVRTAVGIFDVSHMGRFEVSGPRASADLGALLTGDAGAVAVGASHYALLLDDDGGVIDDLLAYRLAQDSFLLIVNAANRAADLEWISARCEDVRDVSERDAMIAVQGPEARGLLERLASAEPPARGQVAELEIAGTRCVACATGYSGEPGAELIVPAQRAADVWAELVRGGATQCGLAARDTLRIEAGLPLYGHELSRERRADDPRKLVGFVLETGIPRQGNAILEGGVVTSGTMSPTLGVGIGLGYVDPQLAQAGTPLTIDVRGRERAARVVDLPFHRNEELLRG